MTENIDICLITSVVLFVTSVFRCNCLRVISFLRLYFLRALTVKKTASNDMASCSLLDVYRRFRETYFLRD